MRGFHGSIYYIAPEVIERSYHKECDIWSCGVILFILLSGYPPFSGLSDKETLNKIRKGFFHLNWPEFKNVSPDAKELITCMLKKEPEQRTTLDQALNHSWFKRFFSSESTHLDLNIMRNFQTFNIKNELQHAIYYYMINLFADEEHKNQIQETFKAIDINSDGILSRQELTESLLQLHIPISSHRLDRILFWMDLNQDDKIQFNEFVGAAINRHDILTDENLKIAFHSLDTDHDGELGIEDLRLILKNHQRMEDGQWNNLLQKIGAHGSIKFQDFELLLRDVAS